MSFAAQEMRNVDVDHGGPARRTARSSTRRSFTSGRGGRDAAGCGADRVRVTSTVSRRSAGRPAGQCSQAPHGRGARHPAAPGGARVGEVSSPTRESARW
jgi:hypothetical protein